MRRYCARTMRLARAVIATPPRIRWWKLCATLFPLIILNLSCLRATPGRWPGICSTRMGAGRSCRWRTLSSRILPSNGCTSLSSLGSRRTAGGRRGLNGTGNVPARWESRGPACVHLRVHALDFPDSKGFFTEESLIPIEGSMPGETFRSGKPWVLNRLDPSDVSPEMYAKASGEGMNSFCDVALISRDRLLGVLAVTSREENAFDQGETAFLSQVAQQVAIGVENALAYGEIAALKDKLAQEKLYMEDEIRGEIDFEEIVGQSSALRHVLKLVETVAPSDSTVLLLGETGTAQE